MTEIETLAKKHKWNLPTKCPLCDSLLQITDTYSRIFCPNKNCYTYSHARISRYLRRMGVMHIAGATIDTLMDEGFIADIPDLYTIDWNEVSKLEGFGSVSANKYKKEIEDHKYCTVAQFLSGFNIAGMGQVQISKMIQSMDLKTVLSQKSYASFITEGIGDITARKFFEGLKELKSVIIQTAKYVIFEEETEVELTSNKLEGLSFCFTGKIEGYTRSDLEQMVIENGGSLSSVKKGLSYLVTDDTESGSSKNVKAKSLGIPVISSKQFLKLIGQ